MRPMPVTLSLLTLAALIGATQDARAWGERGHHTVCEVAVMLVKDPELKRFLSSKGHIMGHVCNIPDISWRSLEKVTERSKIATFDDPTVGDEAHFINPETAGYLNGPSTIDLDFKRVEAQARLSSSNPSIVDEYGTSVLKKTPHELAGSSWWRTQQFFNIVYENGLKAAEVTRKVQQELDKAAPARAALAAAQREGRYLPNAEFNRYKAQISAADRAAAPEKKKINDPVYAMIEAMGLMGHFVGDAAQPYHNSSNYNGQTSGHAGIHSYYESQLVNRFGADIQALVYEAAVGEKSDESSDAAKNAIRNDAIRLASEMKAEILSEEVATPADASQWVLRTMRRLSDVSSRQIGQIEAIEEATPGFKKSRGAYGKAIRPFADQLDAETFGKYQRLIVAQMGVSASVLAKLWEGAYAAAGKPKVTYYNSFKYPLVPAYVAPKYINEKLNIDEWNRLNPERGARNQPAPPPVMAGDQLEEAAELLAPPPALSEPDHDKE